MTAPQLLLGHCGSLTAAHQADLCVYAYIRFREEKKYLACYAGRAVVVWQLNYSLTSIFSCVGCAQGGCKGSHLCIGT